MSIKSYVLTEEQKRKISIALTGLKKSSQTKRKLSILNTTHGESKGINKTVEYCTWLSIKNRCRNSNSKGYKNYGGRGIKVCEEWQNSYEKFLEDMGRRPFNKYSIERIDNNKGYFKENCKWGTRKEQLKNRRNSIVFNDETATDASLRLGGCRYLVLSRIFLGWEREKAFNTPKRGLPSNKTIV